MRPARLLARLRSGKFNNVSFADARALAEALGFELKEIDGDHHIYAYPGLPELVNLQPLKGEAKPYQIRQLIKLADRYALELV